MANTYDKASLVLIPSGTKEGVCFSQKPTNGDGDFTFSRSTSATRVGPSGYIEKETQNLLLRSNNFTTTWNVDTGITFTSGQSGYDGSNDAWKMDKNANTFLAIRQTPTYSGVVTFSIYAKEGTLRYLNFYTPTANAQIWFDLQAGAVGVQAGTYIENKIEDVGSGWYRCSVTYNASSGGELRIYPSSADGAYTAVAGNIYIQDAQLEQGLVARDYIETTTSAVYGGITDNIPRLDYNGSCPSLLLEPQRTNKLTHSEYINTTTFNQTANLTIENNYAISPEGFNNAARITPTTTNSYHQLRTNLATLGGYDIISCFVKADGYNYVQLTSWAQPADYINFDLTDGSVGAIGSVGPTIYGIDDYGNGWYRVYANVQASGGGVIGIGVVTYALAGWAQSVAGNGTDGILIYGCQIEAATYPTSYIPTYGSAVTRNEGLANITTTNNLIGQTEGTLYWEGYIDTSKSNYGYFPRLITIGDGTTSNFAGLLLTQSNQLTTRFVISNSNQASITYDITTSGTYKIAFSYAENNFSLYVNGVSVGTDTSGNVIGLDYIYLGYEGGVALTPPSHPTKQVLIFPTALTNEEAIALTTI